MKKSGFSLLEIAIVMAVISLVLSGIYVAAAAVNERRLMEKNDRQVYTILTNLQIAFHNQKPQYGLTTIDYNMLKALQIMPADVVDTGVSFLTPYYFSWMVVFADMLDPVSNQYVSSIMLSFMLPPPECTTFLVRHASKSAMEANDINYVMTVNGGATIVSGVTLNQAADFCKSTYNLITLVAKTM